MAFVNLAMMGAGAHKGRTVNRNARRTGSGNARRTGPGNARRPGPGHDLPGERGERCGFPFRIQGSTREMSTSPISLAALR